MEQLKENGIFEKIPNLVEDITAFKELIIEKFRVRLCSVRDYLVI